MTNRRIMLTTMLVIAAACAGCGSKEVRLTLTVHEDGSAEVRAEQVTGRALWERVAKELLDAENPSTAEVDRKIEEYLRESITERMGDESGERVTVKIEKVEITAEEVRVAWIMRFRTLEDLARDGYRASGLSEPMGHLVIDKEQEGRLRITLRRGSGKAEGVLWGFAFLRGQTKGELRLVLPGKVVSSTLGEMKDNATWLTFDMTDDASKKTVRKLADEGIVVVAEPGKLKLDGLPVDSEKLAAGERQAVPGEPPLQDADPGWKAEGVSVLTSTVHYFPAAKESARQMRRYGVGGPENQCTVRGRLYPPVGRQVLSHEPPRLIKALDNLGREVKPARKGQTDESVMYESSESTKRAGFTFDMALELPKPDAEAIEELHGEAVAMTFSRWKEHVIREAKADDKTEIDLGELLSGTKMVVTRVTAQNRSESGGHSVSGSVGVKLTGPPEIRYLKVTVRPENRPRTQSYGGSDHTRKSADTWVRYVTMRYSDWTDDAGPAGPTLLIIGAPQDVKLERVKFTLEALDLF